MATTMLKFTQLMEDKHLLFATNDASADRVRARRLLADGTFPRNLTQFCKMDSSSEYVLFVTAMFDVIGALPPNDPARARMVYAMAVLILVRDVERHKVSSIQYMITPLQVTLRSRPLVLLQSVMTALITSLIRDGDLYVPKDVRRTKKRRYAMSNGVAGAVEICSCTPLFSLKGPRGKSRLWRNAQALLDDLFQIAASAPPSPVDTTNATHN